MPTWALRRPPRRLHPLMRSARLAVWALLVALAPGAAAPQTIVAARFADPTDIYDHGVLGDAIEWRSLEIETTGTIPFLQKIRLPRDHVFEDVAPRLADVTGDGNQEVIVVETDIAAGASLAVYSASGKLAETPHIGQRHRWLAPIGAADLDGDGRTEIAYVDRPHLAKTLRVWRYDDHTLTEIASLPGLTNHRIGDADIAGGIRTCAGRPEMIVANADWSRLIAVSFDGVLTLRDIGPHRGRASFAAALNCS